MPEGVVTLGESMGLLVTRGAGPLARGAQLTLSVAGAESNVAVALARLGVPVTWIGRLGIDAVGDVVRRELGAEGVDLAVVRDPDAPTGLLIKERRSATSTRVHYHRSGSAGSRLEPADVPVDAVAGAGILHVTGITPALSATAASAVERAVDVAKAAGVLISFDVNHRSKLWGSKAAAAALAPLLARSDVVFAGLDEAALFVDVDPDADPAETARALARLGPAQAVVKLGSRGCVAVVDDAVHRQEAMSVHVVDPVGAGDAFVGGYLAGLVAGDEPAARLELAVTLGAYACTVDGDWEGLPFRADLAAATDPEHVDR
ncbi:sugar kinase [Mumia xiangluensis]|uniref:Sugar kinase n=1 Tax=Mumia xiangluensis TaxID=1678900 RepID=A0ABW1QS24_9ACTN